jgi:hypothetical protein
VTVTLNNLERFEDRVGELLTTHDSTRIDFSEYADDPVRFMREVLRFDPWGKQVEICEAVRTDKRTVVRGHHGAGKDHILAALLLWACYARGMLCLAISATEQQLLSQLWANLARLWAGASQFPGELYVGELRINGERRIVARTSASTSNLTGYHNHAGGGVFVAVSESQATQVEAAAFDAAEGNTAGEGSRIVVVGNPVKASGRFYEVSQKPTWRAISISAHDHPNVATGRVVIPGGPAPGWPAEMAAEYGTDSAFYVSRVLGEFPPEGSIDSLVRPEWIDEAVARHEARTGLLEWVCPVLALDVARSIDRDENVAAIAQGPRLHGFHAWHSRNLIFTADNFVEIADATEREWLGRSWSPAEVEMHTRRALPLVVDAPGIGSGVVDHIRAKGRAVREHWGWVPAEDARRFANHRAAVFFSFRRQLENGTGELPRDPKLREEALAMQWTQDAKGRILMISKDDLRKAIGRSPDRLDAGVLALHEAETHRAWQSVQVAY